MNNQRSGSEQIILFLLLAMAAMYFSQQFFGNKGGSNGPDRPAPPLIEAFARIDPQNPAGSTPFTPQEAEKEKGALLTKIEANKEDPQAYWSRLRIGLLEQYILSPKDPKAALKYYDDIINHYAGDAIEAQAQYQKGDLLWDRAKAPGATTEDQTRLTDATNALSQLINRARGEDFLNAKIYIPKAEATALASKEAQPVSAQILNATLPGTNLPVGGFSPVKVADLRHGPNSVLARVNDYYSTTTYYKVFDTVVQWFGSQPAYSYGLAIIFFATITRLLVQPLNKKQYDSMKGMAVIAPEMKKIQEKYKGKADQQAQVQMYKEIQALQKQHGVNPMLGCGMALVQMPIFFLFVYPLIQHYEPKLELVGASFLWVRNLSEPDIPLLILYAISMFLSFRLSSVPPTDDMQRQQQMIMSIVFPFMFPFFLIGYASAFIMYWMIYNVVSTVFQYRMMKAADPTKSVVKSLLTSPAAPVAVIDETIPPRPKSGKDETKSGLKGGTKQATGTSNTTPKTSTKLAKSELKPSQNGSTNGHARVGKNGSREVENETNGNKTWSNDLNGALTAANGDALDEGDETEVTNSKVEKGDGSGAQNRKNNSSQRARRRRRY